MIIDLALAKGELLVLQKGHKAQTEVLKWPTIKEFEEWGFDRKRAWLKETRHLIG